MTMCIADKVKAQVLQSAVNVTAAVQTGELDLKDIAHQGIRAKLASITTLSATDDVIAKLQHSDVSGSGFADVDYAPAKKFSDLAAGEELSLPYEGIKRYLRLSLEVVGSPDIVVDSYGILQPNHLPA